MRKKNNSVRIIFLLSIYYYLLLWVYENLVASRWYYRGFANDFSNESLLISIVGFSFTTMTFIIINKKHAPSAMIMNLFDLLFFIPMYVYIAFNKISGVFLFYLFIYQTLTFLIYIANPFKLRRIFKPNELNFKLIVGSILLTTLFINGYYNGFKLKLDLTDVYANRLEVREMSIPSLFRYIKAASYLVGSIALLYALKVKNWILVLFVVLVQLMSFAFGSSKTLFFSIILCLLVFKFYSDKLRLWALFGLIGLLTISIFEYNFIGSTLVSDISVRRLLFVPPKISYNMFDFFETPGREFLYLRGSIFRFFGFEDPYMAQEGFQRLIGKLYDGTDDTNANTGLLGNDYAQLGWWSLIFYPLLRVYILKLYDYCSVGIDNKIMVVISIFISFAFISGAFFTVLITNAVLLACYLLYSFPKRARRIEVSTGESLD